MAQARLIILGPVDTFAAIPNLTGDGRPALAVSTAGEGFGRPLAGVVYVLFGTSRTGTVSLGDPTLRGFKIVGAQAYDEAGFHITAAGDVNHDGRGDILLTAPRNGFTCASVGDGPCGNAPRDAYVIYGKADEGTVDLAHLRRSQGFVIKGLGGGRGDIAGLGRFDGGRYGAIAVGGGHDAYVIYGGRDPANVDSRISAHAAFESAPAVSGLRPRTSRRPATSPVMGGWGPCCTHSPSGRPGTRACSSSSATTTREPSHWATSTRAGSRSPEPTSARASATSTATIEPTC